MQRDEGRRFEENYTTQEKEKLAKLGSGGESNVYECPFLYNIIKAGGGSITREQFDEIESAFNTNKTIFITAKLPQSHGRILVTEYIFEEYMIMLSFWNMLSHYLIALDPNTLNVVVQKKELPK